MIKKLKIAVLGLLGLSTAACCGTKKANKSQDKQTTPTEVEDVDPRIELMYGVPFPDGQLARPIEDEKAASKEEAATEKEAVQYPDGAIAKPLTDEHAAKLLDEVRKEKEQNAQE